LAGCASAVSLDTTPVAVAVPIDPDAATILTFAVFPAASDPRLQETDAPEVHPPRDADDDCHVIEAGRETAIVTPRAVAFPWLAIVNVNVTRSPTTTGFGDATAVTTGSAPCGDAPETTIVADAVLFAAAGSVTVPVTVADVE
jgi:hypothetical protein